MTIRKPKDWIFKGNAETRGHRKKGGKKGEYKKQSYEVFIISE